VADLSGTESIEIEAPIERVFEVAADVERAPEWQGTMRSANALEHDDRGRPILVASEIDASVATVELLLRFSYEGPGGMRWVRESGDLKSLEGSWTFEDLGGLTRATYSLDIGLNRGLSLLAKTLRGPAEARVRHLLAYRPVEGLKARAEGR
jgi:hypothetical protein